MVAESFAACVTGVTMSGDDDWTAAVADKMIRQTRLAADRLVNSGVRPVGLAPGSHRPAPAYVIGDVLSPAADRRPGGSVTGVRIRYGNPADQAAEVIEITSDFTPDCESCCPLEYELGRAQHEYEAMAMGEREIADPVDEPDGPFAQASDEILVDAMPREVAVVSLGDYRALRFTSGGVHATVVGRYRAPVRLSFEPIADLTPYFPGVIDREELRRQLKEMRREPPAPSAGA